MRFLPDPSFTFETFVAGPGSRMAAAAARRAAESPGTSYNPLFLYGPHGVGKTHLLRAVGDHALTVRPDLRVLYATLDAVVDDVSAAVAEGTLERWREEWLEAGMILLDDVQALSARTRTQEELLRLWDEIVRGGAQVVLAADRAPVEIGELDETLRARLTGGLTVDVAPPEPETRARIVEQWARSAHVPLSGGVAAEIARLPFVGVEVLQGAVERVGEEQRSRGRPLAAAEVAAMLAPSEEAAPAADEFSAFLSDIAFTVEQLVEAAPWRRTVAEAILRWEGEGVRTRRLEEALEADSAPDVEALVEGFAADVARLRETEKELLALDAEAARSPVLKDPDRLEEARGMLARAREAARGAAASAPPRPAGPPVDRWFLNAEKMAWGWLALEDRLIEELG